MKISILGAHTAAAKALAEVLEEREVAVELTKATTSEHLEEGLDLIDDGTLRSADLIVLAFNGPTAHRFAEAARALGKPVLDLAEELADEKRAQYIFPGVDPHAGASFDPSTYALIPLGLGATIVSVLRALAPFAPSRATVATYESTAALGQPGMDELSDQVRARFNMRDVEPAVFPAAIAFGTIPSLGGPGASPFDADDRLRRAIESGTEEALPELDLSVARVLVPTFSADSAMLIVDTERSPAEDEVAAALERARGIHWLGEELASSLDAIGRDDALAGRLSVEPAGDDAGRISLWIASDRLRRGSATLAALAIERFLAARTAS